MSTTRGTTSGSAEGSLLMKFHTDASLPEDATAIAKVARECKSDRDWWDLTDRIIADRKRGIARGRQRAADRLYEGRLLHLVRLYSPQKRAKCSLYGLDRAWECLVHLRSNCFARILISYLGSQRARAQCTVAESLAHMGRPVDIPLLKRAFLRGGWPLRGAIARGWGLSARFKHSGVHQARSLRAWLAASIDGRLPIGLSECDRDGVMGCAESLPLFDGRWAARQLRSPNVMRPHNRAIGCLLEEIHPLREITPRWFASPIKPTLLWPVFEALVSGGLALPGAAKDRRSNAMEAAARILTFAADADPVRTKAECTNLLKRAEVRKSYAGELIREAIRRCRGVASLDELLSRLQSSPQSLGQRARTVMRAYEMIDHCTTDGLPLYFANLGEHWREAERGLKLLKLHQARKILAKAGAAYESLGSKRMGKQCDLKCTKHDSQFEMIVSLDDPIEKTFQRARTTVVKDITANLNAYRLR